MDKESLKPIPSSEDKDDTASLSEVEKFSKLAQSWWNPEGPMKPLHKFNPCRLSYIRDQAIQHFNLNDSSPPLAGLRILDIGCGGGLMCEPLARLGAEVVGIDASEQMVEVAKLHAQQMDIQIDYRFINVETLAAKEPQSFDIVINLEVVEHVSDPDLFMTTSAQLVKPQGMLIAGTLNRTFRSWALAIVAAEYILKWLPRGTHDHNKFMKPSELAAPLKRAGLSFDEIMGVTYSLFADQWQLNPHDSSVNYMMKFSRAYLNIQ